VLIVSPFLPYPLSHGGAVRIYNLCQALSDRVDFVLAAVRESQDVIDYEKLHEVFREVYVVDKDERASGSEELPAQVREHQSRALNALIGELSRKWKPDLLQIEYTHIAAVRQAAPETPAILVEHDLTFSLYRQLAEKEDAGSAAGREYQRWRKFEGYWLGDYDAVWTVSSDDCEAAAREGDRRPGTTFTVPNGVDISRFVPREEPPAVPEILYVGSFRHLPNILGFVKLLEEVMPRLWNSFPDVRLRVVAGPQHELFWNRFARTDRPATFDGRIEVHGFVEDLRPLYAKAAVVVVPLEVSAGTNIKVLEAMACGKAVVTTPIGCAGLALRDRQDAFIEGDWAGFARAVGELLCDAALRSRVAAEARRTAEDRFSWTAIAQGAYESYMAMAAARSPRTSSAWRDRPETHADQQVIQSVARARLVR
jgi:glycosyltransferase involved in cell wall biosynthesis